MERRLGWYVLGVLTGVVVLGVVLKMRERGMSAEALVDNISDRLKELESQYGS